MKALTTTRMFAATVAATLASLLFAGAASATTIGASQNIFLNQSGQDDLLPDGLDYLIVNIADGVDGAIDFIVEPLQPLIDLENELNLVNSGIQAFAFNFGSSGATLDNVVPANTSWNVGGQSVFHDFGEFDAVVFGTERKRSLRFSIVGVEGDTVTDYLTALSQGDASQGNWLFGAEVGAEGVPPELADLNPAKFAGGTVVPLPATAGLMLTGLGMLAFMRRRTIAGGK